MQDVQEVHCVS